jgi:hypothetical protein
MHEVTKAHEKKLQETERGQLTFLQQFETEEMDRYIGSLKARELKVYQKESKRLEKENEKAVKQLGKSLKGKGKAEVKAAQDRERASFRARESEREVGSGGVMRITVPFLCASCLVVCFFVCVCVAVCM